MKTVATLPGAFYLLQCAALFVSLVLLSFIQLRREGISSCFLIVEREAGRHLTFVPAKTGTCKKSPLAILREAR